MSNGGHMIKYIKSEKGITLVVLVITIIVMMILTTITVNLSFGPDGILQMIILRIVWKRNYKSGEKITQNMII